MIKQDEVVALLGKVLAESVHYKNNAWRGRTELGSTVDRINRLLELEAMVDPSPIYYEHALRQLLIRNTK